MGKINIREIVPETRFGNMFIILDSVWPEGTTGTMHLTFPMTVSSWHVKMTFTAPVSELSVWVGGNITCSESGITCEFDNLNWDGDIAEGMVLDIPFRFRFVRGNDSKINRIELLG